MPHSPHLCCMLGPQQAAATVPCLQVTPILGMLSLIQEDRLHASGKLSKVHFVWATRNPNDFFFLDPALVEEAAHPDSWLKISLYATAGPAKPYLPGTGSDADLDQQKAARLAFAQSEVLGSSPHGAQHAAYVAKRTSPFFFSSRYLQAFSTPKPAFSAAADASASGTGQPESSGHISRQLASASGAVCTASTMLAATAASLMV